MANAKKPTKPRKIKARPVGSNDTSTGDSTLAPEKPRAVEDAIIVEEPNSAQATENDKNNRTRPVPAPIKPKRGSAVPLLAGGLLAGAIGFGAALFATGDFGPFKADSTVTDQLSELVAAQRNEIDALKDQLAGTKGSIEGLPTFSDMENIGGRIDNVDNSASDHLELTKKLIGRVADLENRPIPDVGATAEAVATYEKELAAMRQMFAQELVRIEEAQVASAAAQTDAAIQSDSVAKRVALAAIQSAVENGGEYSSPLEELKLAGVEIPDGLGKLAENGVPTLSELQQQYPESARAALSASLRSEKEAGTSGSFATFLRTQFGARSLGPREGDDADAILSRAEEALRTGNVTLAISELSALPESGADKMANWVQQAQDYSLTVDGVAALSTTMGF